ncbi:sensor histidine kinase [Tenacibaculum aquimarinum]|uniref:sensor histidine kinase n=1 Tax=Tenacibaculum aquimarinum TaxID=2910675 RepID=UPI001F0B0FBD|nr:ATP-binding protein [Tenacibaculum aquimarinum]MCH3881659.1 histidine kinase [Tenacibaculum aquimarinum]
MQQEGSKILIISTLIIVVVIVFLIILFTVFQRRKNKLLEEKEDQKKRFEREIGESQIEIREQTLRNISWELHDNIGQLLTLAKIQLQNATEDSIPEISETITKSLTELRILSKLINPEFIKNIELKDAIQLEVDRFNRLNFLESKLIVNGESRILDQKAGIIIFRMLQEFFSNTVKHSKATKLDVELTYTETELKIKAEDNGIGFDTRKIKDNGIGLTNIKKRAEIIGALANLTSIPDKGTYLIINHYF